MSAGPSHPCNFHLVGEQFDATWLGSTAEPPLRGVQTFGVAPGGGMVFEMIADIAGEFPFVNHGFGHGQKGGIGFLVVEEWFGHERPEKRGHESTNNCRNTV